MVNGLLILSGILLPGNFSGKDFLMNHTWPLAVVTAVVLVLLTSGCEPEVGSEAWCEAMKEKSQGDWTFNEAAEFTKSCVIAGLKSD